MHFYREGHLSETPLKILTPNLLEIIRLIAVRRKWERYEFLNCFEYLEKNNVKNDIGLPKCNYRIHISEKSC